MNELVFPERLCEVVVKVVDVVFDEVIDIVVNVVVDVIVVYIRQSVLVLQPKDTLTQTLFPMPPKVQTPNSSEQNLSHCVL